MAIEGKIPLNGKEITYHLIVDGKPFDYITKIAFIVENTHLNEEEKEIFEKEINKRYRVDGILYPD